MSLRRPKGSRRTRWWHLSRSVRKNRRAYMDWWVKEWARVLGAGISIPAREWFSIVVTM